MFPLDDFLCDVYTHTHNPYTRSNSAKAIHAATTHHSKLPFSDYSYMGYSHRLYTYATRSRAHRSSYTANRKCGIAVPRICITKTTAFSCYRCHFIYMYTHLSHMVLFLGAIHVLVLIFLKFKKG